MKRRVISVVAVAMLAMVFGACKGGASKAGLILSKNSFIPGEVIMVKYTALPEYDPSAWIGIIPSTVPHGSEAENDKYDMTYQYLQKSTAGEKNFRAPMEPGKYDLRMHDTDNNGIEVASVTFEVKLPPQLEQMQKAAPEKPAAQEEPKPAAQKFSKGDPVMVEWKGSWWPAKVIAFREGSTPYKIHYDGYSSSWDEWVGLSRIKNR